MNVRECAEQNNVALLREGTAEVCCQEGGTELGNMDQWQILANVTLHRDRITRLSCQELGKLELWQSLANGHDCDRMDEIGKVEH